jgi:DNA-binding response OmpR family regulator
VKTIIVLEDEPLLMKLMRNLLDRQGYAVLGAAGAEQALEQFHDSGRRVDLLIADVVLPELSGIEVALRLRSQLPNLPVILTSGYPPNAWNVRDSRRLVQLGVDSVSILLKPFGARVLLNTVRDLTEARPSEVLRAGAL